MDTSFFLIYFFLADHPHLSSVSLHSLYYYFFFGGEGLILFSSRSITLSSSLSGHARLLSVSRPRCAYAGLRILLAFRFLA